MDWSFSNSIACSIGAKNIISTAYYSNSEQMYCARNTQNNVSSLRQKNASELFNIDAIKLNRYNFKLQSGKTCKVFDKIVFAFPYSVDAHGSSKRRTTNTFNQEKNYILY